MRVPKQPEDMKKARKRLRALPDPSKQPFVYAQGCVEISREHKLTDRVLALEIGRPRSWVSSIKRLAELPYGLRKRLNSDKKARFGKLFEIAHERDPARREILVNQYRQNARLGDMRRARSGKTPAAETIPDPRELRLKRHLLAAWKAKWGGCPVTIQEAVHGLSSIVQMPIPDHLLLNSDEKPQVLERWIRQLAGTCVDDMILGVRPVGHERLYFWIARNDYRQLPNKAAHDILQAQDLEWDRNNPLVLKGSVNLDFRPLRSKRRSK